MAASSSTAELSAAPSQDPPSPRPVAAINSHAAPAERHRRWETHIRVGGGVLIVLIAVSLGGGLPCTLSQGSTACSCSKPVTTASAIIGWGYFACWSMSFWPQTLLNWSRRSVEGLSFDYVILNMVGFTCYALFNCMLYYNAEAKLLYADSHHGEASGVRANDVFFALHACLLTAVQCGQIAVYERGGQRVSLAVKLALALFALGLVAFAVPVGLGSGGCSWLNRALVLRFKDAAMDEECSVLTLLYVLSYVKLAITLTKYIPQLLLNIRRRSTVGWNIDNVCLDFAGGSLSVAQLLLDAGCSGQWSQLIGDPVKFGLGFASMVFDTAFMLQHFVLYRAPRAGAVAPASPLRERLMRGQGEPPSAAPSASPIKERAISGLMEPE